jgi:hypothetical protein
MITALRKALELAPGSLRALAREADVPVSTLIRARKGEIGLTPRVASAVALALRRWSGRCANAAEQLEAAVKQAERNKE